ncbi:hypothetical protein [Paenarthrobacter nicotinovorans]|jgi:hypothetical protein|uniref:hypothetical protein n=1 Tax=Paenarthrobacter nicotinovorans TaxID=29320 RepID=UPI0006F63135|nr:hypothetical protein [Paenarthrobacter nicotinovorans]KQR06616.1 hypothetical protein ASF74_04435 [Arthrobacter sp. Leaf145]MDI2020762.1 hypothetical protein [Paenarthrobacter nicotinovorans]SKB97163.1 hypothetical protein SAMN05660916_03635 [Arthrobacter sp. 31Cvi3.1E]
MMARRLVIAGICLAVLIAAVAILFDQLAVKPAPSAQTTSSSSPSPGSTAPGSTASPGTTSQGAEAPGSGSSPSDASASGGTENGGDGGSSPSAGQPLEVLPPVTATPTGLPAPTAPAPLITGALPEPGTAAGEMVDGWPAGILTLPAGSTIGSTSVSTSGNTLQVAADGIIDKPRAEVLGSFRDSLVSHGFWSEDAPAAEGSSAARFVRGTDTVTVSVSTTGTGSSRFQLLGSLHTAAD